MASDYTKRAQCRITERDSDRVDLIVELLKQVGLRNRQSEINPAMAIDRSTVLREAITLGLMELLIREGSGRCEATLGDYHERRSMWQRLAAQEAERVILATLDKPCGSHDPEMFERALTALLRRKGDI